MKGNYELTDRKLSDEEFKEKYYVKGIGVEQYHTMDIYDGLDERQQLLINNDRCLMNYYKSIMIDRSKVYDEVREKTGNCIKTAMIVIAVQIMICTATTVLMIIGLIK